MDAHGGWLASAQDLVRFGSALGSSDAAVLSDASRKEMLNPPDCELGPNGERPESYYGLGWRIRELGGSKKNFWHAGSLPGCSTLLVVRHDGFSWAVLFNSREMPGEETPAAKIDPLIHEAVDAVEEWPDHDLFRQRP
jgi:N-acyl-D-amino-acid deacylase